MKSALVASQATSERRHARTVSQLACVLLSLLSCVATQADAQDTAAHAPVPDFMDIGSDAESRVRYLQSLGIGALTQWNLRSFGPREIDAMRRRPDTASISGGLAPSRDAAPAWRRAPLVLDLWYNSTFPFGSNDGPVWRGRGATLAIQGGGAVRIGILSAALRPVAFWSENRRFPLFDNGQTGPLAFADPLNPTTVDRPQRFGDAAYARVSLGESYVRADAGPVTAGLATTGQWWGPMTEWPYLLSTNAEGFPHLFIGTAAPVNVGIGRLHARAIYGRLRQSEYTDIVGPATRRLASGLAVTFLPRVLPGLEVGAARFFHEPWPREGFTLGALAAPFEDFFKRNVAGDSGSVDRSSADNQLASVFARWVFPTSGLEIFGEYGREDHSFDERDFILSPDHQATLGLGLRKAWHGRDGRLMAVRAEFIDLDPSNMGRNRLQGTKYLHYTTRQGHTVGGQLIGSGFSSDNGAGTLLALERFDRDGGRDELSLRRMVVRERVAAPSIDAQYAVGGMRTRRYGSRVVSWGFTGVFELNRYFTADAGALMASARLTW